MKGQTLVLALLFCVVSPRFQPYACISERAVKLKMYVTYQETFDPEELVVHNDVSAKECTKHCQNFAFMFYTPSNRSETFNCICFRRIDRHLINNNPTSCTDDKVEWHPLKIIPSDITSKPDSSPFKRCAPFYGFMLSCQQTETYNWCQDLDEYLDSFDYEQKFPKPASLTFPQCMKSSDFKWNETETIRTTLVKGLDNCTATCIGWRGDGGTMDINHYYILQGDNCWCAKENFLVENKGFYENSENCTACNTTMGNYEYGTCGNDINHNLTDSKLSVYCGQDNCRTPVAAGEEKKFAYFGCVKKNVTEVDNYDHVASVEACLTRCQTSSTMYIKPNRDRSDLTCICEGRNETSIEDMSLGCTDTWSPAIHGPTGSLANDQEGYALYCWPEVCKWMANQGNFYTDSPGNKLYNLTTTTLPPTAETAATIKRCTKLRTTATTSSTTTESTTTESTTTESTTTPPPTTMQENVTQPLRLCCGEEVDNRGMLWNATCGFHNLTTHCPSISPGFAVWTCDTAVGEFIPKQVR